MTHFILLAYLVCMMCFVFMLCFTCVIYTSSDAWIKAFDRRTEMLDRKRPPMITVNVADFKHKSDDTTKQDEVTRVPEQEISMAKFAGLSDGVSGFGTKRQVPESQK